MSTGEQVPITISKRMGFCDTALDRIRPHKTENPRNHLVLHGFLYCIRLLWIVRWCRRRDLNSHDFRHYPLKIACLPIPPPRREKRYMQNRGGWQAFFCDSVKFFRLSAWGPGLFPCAGVTDGSSGEDPHSLLWKGRRNLFVSAAEGSFLGAAEPSALGKPL